MTRRRARLGLSLVLAAVLAAGVVLVVRGDDARNRNTVVGYFANSNGLFVGDEVRILGVAVGKVERIEPLPGRAKITFWFDRRYPVPADANAVILSPTLVSARAIQLTPAYSSGPTLNDGAVLPQSRTAVPVEWDDLRQQLQKLTATLQPTQPGGVAPLGSFINTAADGLNLLPPCVPNSLTEFVDLVLPELRHRGLFRTEYEGRTLRDNLGLQRPNNSFLEGS